MVIEYAKFGNLRQYLRARRPTTSDYVDTSTENSSLTEEKRKKEESTSMTDLVSFSFQIARGMEYLESKKVCDAKQLFFYSVYPPKDFPNITFSWGNRSTMTTVQKQIAWLIDTFTSILIPFSFGLIFVWIFAMIHSRFSTFLILVFLFTIFHLFLTLPHHIPQPLLPNPSFLSPNSRSFPFYSFPFTLLLYHFIQFFCSSTFSLIPPT